ncbi:helix-turn-helix transcriptional regulator [Oenococcus oeni]|uniref:Transcriptional regulator, Cro/CI family n=5 Tax=root TaxID=1 RepID=V9QIX4_9CAUD|nr:helix-turn-helix transcriptional regulator [Oenococcus oeni]YP_009005158.1 helix-turn-helix domain-containing protein [Oenococcus phage phi9805]YP_009005213.1 helix-turn-helix domain-containing protein [Oenococcus phage phiS13]YP_009006545.1 helix-turn-helix domain-containing protein [Oenococcus phage phiS11]AHB80304.1 Phage transcriptional regulatory, Cro/C1 family [Oenococcus phage phiS11]AHB80363.1 Phage transcription regulator, Cro/C1 family [Oenococcus phage phiS13]AHC30312.1 transcri
MNVYERISEVARTRGMTIVELSEKSGVTVQSLNRWKKQDPKSGNLANVADVLHVSVDYLLGRGNSGQLSAKQLTLANSVDPSATDEQIEKINEYIDFIQNKKK